MLYLLQALSGWLIAASGLGLLVGFFTCEPGRPGSWKGGPFLFLLAWLAGAVIAALCRLPGRYGFWLETALLLFAAYVLGCLMGCLLRRLFTGPGEKKAIAKTASPLETVDEHEALASTAAPAENPASLADAGELAAPAALFATEAAPVADAATEIAAAETDAAALADGVKALADRAGELAAAVPAVLAANELAQKLLDEAHTPVAEAASQIAPTENDAAENPTEGLAEGVQALTEHAGALAAAAPAALAANEAAQKLLAEAPPESAPTEKTAQPPSMPRPDLWADEDNLLLVRGIGPALSHDLHQVNIWRFGQIAAWTPEQVAWIARKFPHHGPVAPRFWPAQAQLLAGGVMTDYARAHLAGETLQGAPLDDTSILAWHAALPRAIAPDANDELYAGQRPLSLLHPPLGESDDLSRIDGVDAPLAARLNALGVWTWGQIAHWSAENARWIGAYLADPGRVEREAWVAQAKGLVA